MTRLSWLAPAIASLILAVPAARAAETDTVEFMTQNQYVGMDLLGLVNSSDFNAAVIDALQARAASLPAERAQALAALIARRMPALVALEEVYRFTCFDTNPLDLQGCENPAIAGAFTDQLADTLASLHGHYRAAAHVDNLDLPASIPALNGYPGVPVAYDGQVIFVGVLDRDVVLARDDVTTTPLPFKAFCFRPSATSEGCNYAFVASATLTLLGQSVPVNFERGFVGVAASVRGQPYKFVATHLETRLDETSPLGRVYQSGQAAELQSYLQALAGAPGKLIVAGDFNSDPRDQVMTLPPDFVAYLQSQGVPPALIPYLGVPPYQLFAAAGFTDAWTMRPGAARANGAPLVGFSCCEDADLANRKADLYERIDLIWSLTRPLQVQDARLLGESISDKTPPVGIGVWPSDHASVAAKLVFAR